MSESPSPPPALTIEESIEELLKADACTRQTIARVYREGIVRSRAGALNNVDWHRINAAILQRYKPSGLEMIKKLAWKVAHV